MRFDIKDHRLTAVAKLLRLAGEIDDDHVLAAPADVGVLAGSAVQHIVTGSTDQPITASPSVHDVVPFQAVDAVRRVGAADVVGLPGAPDLVPCRGEGRGSEEKDGGQEGVPHVALAILFFVRRWAG
jgi:hypothetical protein